MRLIDISVQVNEIIPNKVDIGYEGEHNATKLRFTLEAGALAGAEFYRVAVGDFHSERLNASSGKVEYLLPIAVMQGNSNYIQLEGYAESEGEITLIKKSPLITGNIKASVNAGQAMPKTAEKTFESAYSQLKFMVENATTLTAEGEQILEEVAAKRAEITAAVAEADQKAAESESSAQAAENSAEAAATATQRAQAECNKAAEYSENAKEAEVNATSLYASMCAEMALVSNCVAEANNSKLAAETFARLAAEESREAAEFSLSAASDRTAAAIYAEQAEEHALSAQNSLQRFATIIDEQLPVYSSIYHNAAPDWVEHNEAAVDPYTWGKDVYFTADIKRGEKYLVRVWLQHQEDYNDITVMLATKNASESEQRVDDCKTPLYNQALGCYEAEFVSVRDFAEGEEFMLFVGYPLNRENLCDDTAIFGKAEILINDNLHNIVEKQNKKIAAIGGEIEAALDGIIAIQNNLIGGDSV